MGSVRDFLKKVGVVSATGTTISNFGQRLLDLRNEFNKIGERKKAKR